MTVLEQGGSAVASSVLPVPSTHTAGQQRAPMAEAIARYQALGTVSFHCPSHKGGAAADPALRQLVGPDLLAGDVWLGTSAFDAARREAEDLAAELWGADRAYFLGNGSSSGNQAVLLATTRPGDRVVVARDVHVSAHTALILTGAQPSWISPQLGATGLPNGVDVAAVERELNARPDARLLLVVSPSYAGGCSDLAAIALVAHARGVAVVVDEAWGAHLPFHPDLPVDGLSAGADAVVTSTHKLGGSISQSALLLAQGDRIDLEAVDSAVRMMSTTSPLLPMLASIDLARRRLASDGRDDLTRAIELARQVRTRLGLLPGLRVVSAAAQPNRPADPLKLVVDVRGRGITGVEAERALRGCGIAPEGSDLRHVLFVVSCGDSPDTVQALVAAMDALPWHDPCTDSPAAAAAVWTPGEQILTPRDAWFAPSESVPLEAAAGRVAAELVTPYPPGIPALVPGETVSTEHVRQLEAALAARVHIHGTRDPALRTILVVRSPSPA